MDIMGIIPLPQPKAIKDIFEDLLGREITVAIGKPMTAEILASSGVGVFVDDELNIKAVMVSDIRMSAYTGSSLGLIPPAGAERAIETEALQPMMAENLSEVFNILSALVNIEGGPHLRLQTFLQPGDPIPNDVKAIVLAFGRRLNLDVEVSGYGTGRFTVAMP